MANAEDNGSGVPPTEMVVLAAQLSLLADPLRLTILRELAREELCTCHLMELTGAKQTTISHHLRTLREAGVVIGQGEGRFTWYRLAPGVLSGASEFVRGLVGSAPSARQRAACTPKPIRATPRPSRRRPSGARPA